MILVGEMRDLETIRLALTAAETGHLVFGTLHTSSAAKTIDRIIDVFPAAEKEMVRAMLSESLRAVISQTLLQDQGRRGPRRGARDHDRHAGDPQPDPREQDRADVLGDPDRPVSIGMQTLDQCLTELVRATWSSSPEARAARRSQQRHLRRLSARAQETIMEREQAIKFMHDLLRLHGRAEGLGPVHHRRLPAGDQGRRQDHAGVEAAR